MTAAARSTFENALQIEAAGNSDKALALFLKALEQAPQDTEIAYKTASALLRAGYLEEAQSQLRRIVFSEPDHLMARASLANCQLLSEDLENARLNFCIVLEQEPTNKNALYGFASVLLKEGKPQDAEVPAYNLVQVLPENSAALTLYAETQAKTRNISAAIATYRKALKGDPQYLPALLGLSQTLLLRKRFDEAIDLTVQAAHLSPSDPLPLEMLSEALHGAGQFRDAVEACEAALKLAPKSVLLLTRLSLLNRQLENYPKALRHALNAHDLAPSEKAPVNAIGAVLAALKYPAEARQVLTSLQSESGIQKSIRALVLKLISSGENSDKGDGPSDIRTEDSRSEDTFVRSKPDKVLAASPSRTDSEPLPNVLGLARRDVS